MIERRGKEEEVGGLLFTSTPGPYYPANVTAAKQ